MILSETGGNAVYFSEPMRMSEFQRICYVKFDQEESF